MRRESLAAWVLLTATVLAGWAAAPRVCAQSPPRLGLTLSAAEPVLSLTGDVGSALTVQYVTSLSATNNWQFLTNLTPLRSSPYSVADATSMTNSRFYRVFSQQVPTNVVTTNMVWISPGTFTMGSPTNEAARGQPAGTDETQHNVTISRGFWMGKYLVKQGDYLAVVGSNPSYFNGDRSGPPDYDKNYGTDLTRPVETVTWFDASNYCALRTQQERAAGLIPTNYVYRLPTESEWEYAARAGTTTAFYLGCDLHSGQANFIGTLEYDCVVGTISNPSGISLGQITPVGSYAPNPWGLYDMAGNVFEWCQDWYGTYPAGSVTDPQGPALGSTRVDRGGNWNLAASNCRSAFRRSNGPAAAGGGLGFRAVLAPIQP